VHTLLMTSLVRAQAAVSDSVTIHTITHIAVVVAIVMNEHQSVNTESIHTHCYYNAPKI
jgi:hypothetical protein